MKKSILISGVTGSLGKALVKELYHKYNITGIARSENKIWQMENEYPDIEYVCCDIRNITIEKEFDYIIHTACLKHVKYNRLNPEEGLDINVIGTIKMIQYALKYCRKKFVFISSDKSIEPVNFYGCTKMMGEIFVNDANNKKPIFNIVRFGNLFGSSGSIVLILQNEKGVHKLTDINAKRYFITFGEAVTLIKKAMQAKAGSVIYKKSKVIKIIDLIRAIKGDDAEIEITQLGPGEKLMEKIDHNDNGTYEYYSVDEIRELLNE